MERWSGSIVLSVYGTVPVPLWSFFSTAAVFCGLLSCQSVWFGVGPCPTLCCGAVRVVRVLANPEVCPMCYSVRMRNITRHCDLV